MKKLLTLLLTLLMVFTLVGCNSTKEEEPVVVNTPEINEPVQEEIVGGFISVEDGTLTDKLKAIFNKALDGLTGATYEPIELIATQVVAGTNYKFLANGTKTTNPVTKGTYYVTVYEDLNGNVSLLDIEIIEEKQEEISDPTQLSYWVVFKNPDGNELQRTIEKYGTTPVYTGDTPTYWDSENWYRFTNWDQELKPITGNTYITAEYEFGGELKKEEVTPIPSPTPSITPTCQNTSKYLLYIESIESGNVHYYVYNFIKGKYIIDVKPEGEDLPEANFTSGISVGQWIHTDSEGGANPVIYDVCEYKETHDIDSENPSCLAGNTLITMANGEKKKAKELKTGDEIVAFDHDTGKKTTSYVIDFFKYDEPRDGVFTLCFDNNIDVTVVGGHGFYEKDNNKYVTINKNDAHNYLGHSFYNVDEGKWVTLKKIEYSNEKVDTYIVITDKTLNFSANGMLSVEDDIYILIANIFEFDSNLKVNVAKKEADLKKWGYWSFDNLKYMNKEGYDALNLKYLNVAIGKGMITQEEISAEEAYAATFESDYID